MWADRGRFEPVFMIFFLHQEKDQCKYLGLLLFYSRILKPCSLRDRRRKGKERGKSAWVQGTSLLEACSILDPALILTLSHLMFLKKKTQRATESYHPWAPLPAAVPWNKPEVTAENARASIILANRESISIEPPTEQTDSCVHGLHICAVIAEVELT